MAIGADPESFWRTTPKLVAAVFAARGERDLEHWKQQIKVAWHGAAFERVKELPALDSLFGDGDAEREQDAAETLMAHNLALWGHVLEAKFKRKA